MKRVPTYGVHPATPLCPPHNTWLHQMTRWYIMFEFKNASQGGEWDRLHTHFLPRSSLDRFFSDSVRGTTGDTVDRWSTCWNSACCPLRQHCPTLPRTSSRFIGIPQCKQNLYVTTEPASTKQLRMTRVKLFFNSYKKGILIWLWDN